MAPQAALAAADWLRLSCVFTLFLLFNTAESKSIVKELPGYSGNLPFKLETGYVSVGEKDDLQLFYYFIESESNPVKDPLVLWITGGPGCSSFSGLVYEIGPLAYNVPAFNGSLPTFLLNPYSWTKVANIIFLDIPVGTGFSYSTTLEGYYSSHTKTVKDSYSFLRKWLLDHPNFSKHNLYIGGDSYSGLLVPMIVSEISNGNDEGNVPRMSLRGYVLGNPVTDTHNDVNTRIPYAHRMGLISDEYYEGAKSSCQGEYVDPDPNNAQCIYYLRLIEECTGKLNEPQILEPKCGSPWGHRFFEDISSDVLFLSSQQEEMWCRKYENILSYVWANDPTVQQALHIRNGTKTEWRRCNKTLAFDEDVTSVVEYHQFLSRKGYQALVYSGDHDMVIPYIGTLEWIKSLNLTVNDNWRPWFVNGQVAGFTEKYRHYEFALTFATVMGAGHTAPQYKPKQCFAMVERWFSQYQL
ncbi:unnamed protein product [Ilex paraguariensis]|uniref:Uncharacterized protein n=1 Tax=Ilex paraguariensis TaxID=185542 RepID=A0ABC8RCW3_9AQUA